MRRLLMMFLVPVFLTAGPAAGQDWDIQIVDDGGSTGGASRVIATSDGIPYILYQADDGCVTLAWYVTGGGPGGWDRINWVDRDPYNLKMGMEVDDNDKIHLAYSKMTSPYRVKYAVFDHATKPPTP